VNDIFRKGELEVEMMRVGIINGGKVRGKNVKYIRGRTEERKEESNLRCVRRQGTK
jgi:hypothetical protein